MSNLLSKKNFDIEIMGVWDGYEYTLQETKKADNKVNPDLLFSYIDRIDSAVVINKNNDNVHLFYFRGNFIIIITDSMVCEKGKQWRPQGKEWWAYRDTMIFRNNNKNKYISWLPQYVKEALMDGEYQTIEILGTMYNSYNSHLITEHTLKDNHYINGKLIDTIYKSRLYSNMGRNEGIVIQPKVTFYKGKVTIIDKNYISANIYFHF